MIRQLVDPLEPDLEIRTREERPTGARRGLSSRRSWWSYASSIGLQATVLRRRVWRAARRGGQSERAGTQRSLRPPIPRRRRSTLGATRGTTSADAARRRLARSLPAVAQGTALLLPIHVLVRLHRWFRWFGFIGGAAGSALPEAIGALAASSASPEFVLTELGRDATRTPEYGPVRPDSAVSGAGSFDRLSDQTVEQVREPERRVHQGIERAIPGRCLSRSRTALRRRRGSRFV